MASWVMRKVRLSVMRWGTLLCSTASRTRLNSESAMNIFMNPVSFCKAEARWYNLDLWRSKPLSCTCHMQLQYLKEKVLEECIWLCTSGQAPSSYGTPVGSRM